MKVFAYQSKNQEGKVVNGVLRAPDRQTAVDTLKDNLLVITGLRELDAENKFRLPFFKRKTSSTDLMVFTAQLSIALEAGLHLTKSLAMISRDMPEGEMKVAIHDLAEELEKGSTISAAMARHPNIFPRYYRNLIRAGEYSGELDRVLNNLTDYMEKHERTKDQVVKALYYPAMIIVFSFVIVYGVVSFVVPKFRDFYETFGGELPAPTRIFLSISDFLSAYFFLILAVVLVVITLVTRFLKTKKGNDFIDGLKLHMIVMGDLFLKSAISRFATSLAIMYKAGVPIVEALDISAETTGNVLVEKAFKQVASRVKEGERLNVPLRNSGFFTSIALGMIEMGEETGKLQFMLEKLGDLYEKEVENKVKAITAMIEPAMMILMGVIIGITLIIMALPIINLPNIIVR